MRVQGYTWTQKPRAAEEEAYSVNHRTRFPGFGHTLTPLLLWASSPKSHSSQTQTYSCTNMCVCAHTHTYTHTERPGLIVPAEAEIGPAATEVKRTEGFGGKRKHNATTSSVLINVCSLRSLLLTERAASHHPESPCHLVFSQSSHPQSRKTQ